MTKKKTPEAWITEKRIKQAIIIVIVLAISDIFLTNYGINAGKGQEGHPLVNLVANHVGYWWAMVILFVPVVAGLYGLYWVSLLGHKWQIISFIILGLRMVVSLIVNVMWVKEIWF